MTRIRFVGTLLAGIASTWLGPSPGAAQTALAFEAVPTAVHLGETVTVEHGGSQTTGVLKALDTAALVLTGDDGRDRTFAPADVSRIRVQDSIANGAMLGAIAGAVPGALVGRLVYGSCMGDRSSVSKCLPAFVLPTVAGGAVGALVGLFFDDMYQRTIVVGPARPVVRAAPWFDGHGGGVVMRIVY